ncbi:hypothetical protein C9374_005501 [Naegleria lovaniensis]|uniref:Uncharacterized protein n=1 Tax=Naegleria lovaniensis TaxID=51637 RepID=A0AA88GNI0_NAELO|nr:uncharacterized protein C9374_005501 [Naegleria lovaniensis]KAG2382299.1 hypothetical protein C9374_005501 [Naegleria lovaniensis]
MMNPQLTNQTSLASSSADSTSDNNDIQEQSSHSGKTTDEGTIPIDVASNSADIDGANSQPWMNIPQQYLGNAYNLPPNMTPQQYYYMTLWLMQQQQQNGNKTDNDPQKKSNDQLLGSSSGSSNEQDKSTSDPSNVFPVMYPPYFPFGTNNGSSQIPSLNVATTPTEDNSSAIPEPATQEKKTRRRGKNASSSTTTAKSTKKRKNASKESSSSAAAEENANPTTAPDTPKKKKKKETTSSGTSGRGARGLRHFSMKVCELVQRKKTTTINDVADELVQAELQGDDSKSDDKNIRRRVYDALNVLMALNIISKDKKEIKWKGLPVDSQKECEALNQIKLQRMDIIAKKTQQLQELEKQHRSLSNLCQRNSSSTYLESKRIELPFIIVHTSKSTQIECEMDENRSEVFFNFDKPFEIHDDNEILYRLGLDQSSNSMMTESGAAIAAASSSAAADDDFFSEPQPSNNNTSPSKPLPSSSSTTTDTKEMDTQ